MANDGDTAAAVRERLHRITPWNEGPDLGTKVISEGLRQLSLPGQYLRGALAGKPGEKATSRELLGRMGVTKPNPIGEFAWDVATDPLTYAGPGLIPAAGKTADLLRAGGRALGEGPAANPLLNAARKFAAGESGALGLEFDPYQHAAEVGLVRSDPRWVNQRTFYHGTGTPTLTGPALDPMKTSVEGLYGRGIYTTDEAARVDPLITGGYAQTRYRENQQEALVDAGLAFYDQMKREGAEAVLGRWNDLWQRRATGSGPPLTPTQEMMLSNWNYERATSTDALLRRAAYMPGRFRQMFAEGPAGDQEMARLLAEAKFPVPQLSQPRIYQAQSDYGRILDLDVPAHYYRGLPEALRQAVPPKYARRILPEQPLGETFPILKKAFTPAAKSWEQGIIPPDALTLALKRQGFDALTHTGGLRTAVGSDVGPHQVVIGLDPNDVLGMGRATPYRQWSPYASPR